MVAGLTIVMPARNEAETIGMVLRQIRLYELQLPPLEVIVVDDHSTDRTAAIASDYGMRCVPNLDPPGYGYAIRTGLRLATMPWVTIMTADGADDVKDLRSLCAAPGQMIVGNRWPYGVQGYPLPKQVVNRIGNAWIGARLGHGYSDWTNPFKLYPTVSVHRVLPDCVAPDQSAGLELVLRVYLDLWPVRLSIVPHSWQERTAGCSKFRLLRDSLNYYRTVRRVLG